MTTKDELLKNGWQTHWIEEEQGQRELLVKTFHPGEFELSAEAAAWIAELAVKYDLQNDVNLSVSAETLIIFLNCYNPGPLTDSYYSLAKDIERRLSEKIQL